MTYPRGPELFKGDLLVAYRTTPVRDTPAERWELRERHRDNDAAIEMFAAGAQLLQQHPTALLPRYVESDGSTLIATGAPWVPLSAVIAGAASEGLDHVFVLTLVRDVARDLAPLRDVVLASLTPATLAITTAGNPRALDVTLAHWRGRPDLRLRTDVYKGDYHYWSPEAASGGELDKRSDLFALGLIALELLTGMQVFRGESLDVILRIRQARIPPLDRLPDHVPPLLARVLTAMLQRRPDQRYTCSELVSVIESGAQLWTPAQMFEEVRRMAPEAAEAAVVYGY